MAPALEWLCAIPDGNAVCGTLEATLLGCKAKHRPPLRYVAGARGPLEGTACGGDTGAPNAAACGAWTVATPAVDGRN
jgi:hypothetical protein